MICKGDILTIKPEWREAGDEKFTYVARSDEANGVFDMSAVELVKWRIWPSQITRTSMVKKTGRRISENGEIN